uniref:CSON002701 protein n=1 Tax=Culicoides sonorensis TaxID=179676 RepID=A0A336MQR7_CULSO
MSQNMCVNSSPKENNNFHSYSNRSHGNVNEDNVGVLNTSNEMDKKNRRSFELNSNKRDKKDTMIAFNERKMNVITSTPVNSGGNKRNTPNNSNSLRKSAGGGGGSGGSPMCLGDFIVGPMKTKRRSLNTEPKSDNAPSQSSNNEQSSSIKPKKRVAPIMLSKNVSKSDFSNNAFVIDDNFAVKTDELLPAPNERHLLKMNRDAITQDFMEQSHELNAKTLRATLRDKISESENMPQLNIDLSKVTHADLILRLAEIYSILIDFNLTINVLSEISYLVNLINTEIDPYSREMINNENVDLHLIVLKNLNNCIYFALNTLSRLKSLLIMLDVKTLTVLIKNDRIVMNDENLTKFLKSIFQYKTNLASKTVEGDNAPGYSYVFYQQENDSKGNFPTEKEFGAFKKQRDMFYAILKSWEQKHLNPSFNFSAEYGAKVHSLLRIIDHPINMAHLAKLFTAQLIISCNYDEFIIACDNHSVFLEQLKLALIAELMEMNDASYTTHVDIECSIEGLDTSHKSIIAKRSDSESNSEQIIQPSTIITMRVLAKFIGFVTSRPYTYDIPNRNFVVDERQIQLRNFLLPPFDIKSIILKSTFEKKLVVTIPWIVQYLYMLDYVSLCLNYYKDIFRLLYKLYTENYGHSLGESFIIRSCLGWLFEHCSLVDEYFTYRSETKFASLKQIKTISCFNEKLFDKYLSSNLEHLIVAACPFLADLRVSIMPSRFEKQVSRTGRFRHITTIQTENLNNKNDLKELDGRSKLAEAFLQSQSLSVRRIFEFVIERVTSAVVKDFQFKYLIPIKSEAMERVKEIKSTDWKIISKEMHEIYLKSFSQLVKIWDETIEDAVNHRTKIAFEALLPVETIENVKKTCIFLAIEKILKKVNDWKMSHMKGTEIFSKTIRVDAERLAKSNQTDTELQQTNFAIHLSKHIPSEFFFHLQEMQHIASLKPEKLSHEMLTSFFEETYEILSKQLFTANLYRTSGFVLLHIIQTVIVTRPDLIDAKILEMTVKIWKIDKLQQFLEKSPSVHNTTPENESPNSRHDENYKRSKYIFSKIVNPRLILQLDESPTPEISLKCLLDWLKSLLKCQLVKIDRLSDMFVSLFQYEWKKEQIDKIHYLSTNIAEFSKNDGCFNGHMDDEKSNLFLELVADLTVDLDI